MFLTKTNHHYVLFSSEFDNSETRARNTPDQGWAKIRGFIYIYFFFGGGVVGTGLELATSNTGSACISFIVLEIPHQTEKKKFVNVDNTLLVETSFTERKFGL